MTTTKKSSIYKGFSAFSRLRTGSNPSAPEEFGVDFGEFGKLTLKLQVRGDSCACFLALFGRFEQKLPHVARSQALDEVIERTVLGSALAAAVLFAARQILPDTGSAQEIQRRLAVRQERGPALPQGSRAFAPDCLSHIYA